MKAREDRFPVSHVSVSVVSIFMLTLTAGVLAQWVDNGVTVCSDPSAQYRVALAEDGSGGAFIAWVDNRILGNRQIFIQRIDEAGVVQWATDGIQLCPPGFQQDRPKVVYDNKGGSIVFWLDYRSGGEIYAQRLDATGTRIWDSPGGVCVASAVDASYYYSVAMADDGYIYIIFEASNHTIRIQCIDLDGNLQGPIAGIEIVPDGSSCEMMTVDAHGEAIIAIVLEDNVVASRYNHHLSSVWNPARQLMLEMDDANQIDIIAVGVDTCVVACSGVLNSVTGVCALSINYEGNILWGANGNIIGEDISGGNATYPKIVLGSDGGTVIYWRLGNGMHIVGQGISSNGERLWGDGIIIGEHGFSNEYPEALSDGDGCTLVLVSNRQSDIQKMDSNGQMLWTPNGYPIVRSEAGYSGQMPRITANGAGGAIIAWAAEQWISESDIFVQRISSDGFWTDPKAPILAVPDVPDDEGGYVTVNVQASGYDQIGVTTFPITGYNLWRKTPDDKRGEIQGTTEEESLLLEAISSGQEDGLIISHEQSAVLGFPPGSWESIGFHMAIQQPTYDLLAPTYQDSTYWDEAWTIYLVTAHTPNPSIYFVSDPDSGYSVDNLAPALPLEFEGIQHSNPDGLFLSWMANTESDLGWYSVYRGSDEDFVPNPSNLIQNTQETNAFDPEWIPGSVFYYKLAAVDRHGNPSDFALVTPIDVIGTYLRAYDFEIASGCVEIRWSVMDGLEGLEFEVYRSEYGMDDFDLIAEMESGGESGYTYEDCDCEPGRQYSYRVAYGWDRDMRVLFESEKLEIPTLPLTLDQNYPNPFNPRTTISYYLPSTGDIRLAIYDVAGRLVMDLVNGKTKAGRREVIWEGRDWTGREIAAGAYFVRLEGKGEVRTTKILMVR